jgi:hypothetical protein
MTAFFDSLRSPRWLVDISSTREVGLRNVQVRRLWESRYRVNVLVRDNAASAKIAKSYFVKADSDGNIVESNPEMTNLCPIR